MLVKDEPTDDLAVSTSTRKSTRTPKPRKMPGYIPVDELKPRKRAQRASGSNGTPQGNPDLPEKLNSEDLKGDEDPVVKMERGSSERGTSKASAEVHRRKESASSVPVKGKSVEKMVFPIESDGSSFEQAIPPLYNADCKTEDSHELSGCAHIKAEPVEEAIWPESKVHDIPPAKVKPEDAKPALPNAEKEIQMESGKNKKMKKNRQLEFDVNVARRRFERAKIPFEPFPVTLERDIREGMVGRFMMSTTYGGSLVEVCPEISAERIKEHGYNDFMYLPPQSFQSLAPEVPGFPGLFISIDNDNDLQNEPIKRVFTKITTTPAEYQYMGQYQVRPSDQLSKEEWAEQPAAVRQVWAKTMAKPKCRWGGPVRARIYARKTWGREASAEEVKEIIDGELHNAITPEEISLALTRGDECLVLYTLQCIGYDENFQRSCILEKLPKWKAAQRKRRQNKHQDGDVEHPTAQGSSGKRKCTSPLPQAKKSRITEEEAGDKEQYVTRGTRSRPSR